MKVSELDSDVFRSSSSWELLHSVDTHPAVRGRVELLDVAFESFPPATRSFELSRPATDAFQPTELQGPMYDVVGEAEKVRYDRDFRAIIANIDDGIGTGTEMIAAQVAGSSLNMQNSSSAQATDAAPTAAQMRQQIGMEPSYA